MVNNILNPRKIIITTLKKSSTPVSGTELGRLAGISRVAVWKHVKALIDSGYDIASQHGGYLLNKKTGKDIFSNWEFSSYSKLIHLYPVLESTMIEARKLCFKGAPDMTIVTAEKQTAGIAAKNKKWESDIGGLYFTVILKPDIQLQYYNLFNLAAACSVVDFLKKYDVIAQCEWPNNIYTDKGKISGILPEVYGEPEKINFILLGIGVNINNNPGPGTSIKKITGNNIARAKALEEIVSILSNNINKSEKEITSMWLQHSPYKNNPHIRVKKNNKIVPGEISSITMEGNISLKKVDGEIITVFPGDEIISKKGIYK